MASAQLLPSPRAVHDVRHFNRFYTRQIGVLQEGLLASPFSLTEVRVLYELAHREKTTAGDLGRELGLDAGYLSRLLANFKHRGLLQGQRSSDDARQVFLTLTPKGRKVFAPLESRSEQQVAAMLGTLSPERQKELLHAMNTIETLLGKEKDGPSDKASYLLRPHQPGDMGWVVHRHGVLYAQEYGYDERFEALVADLCAADFVRDKSRIARKSHRAELPIQIQPAADKGRHGRGMMR